MKPTTNIHCDGCRYLKSVKIQVTQGKQVYRNIWTLYCTDFKNDVHIKTIGTDNQDLHNAGMPYIEAIFDCPKRQALRKQNKELKYEMSIN